MHTFELSGTMPERGAAHSTAPDSMGSAVLLHNVTWFARIRWAIIAMLGLVGLAGGLLPGMVTGFGFSPPVRWPWVLAGVLAATNSLFFLHIRSLKEGGSRRTLEANIWLQIVTDMLVVTALVHVVGSTQSFVSFIYLFHIVLACLFFSRSRSFLVTLLAAALYFACIAVEIGGLAASGTILLDSPAGHAASPRLSVILAGSAIGVWFGVWYLASTLSEAVRIRDAQLYAVNLHLMRADEEKNRVVLRTVHDLKAPFSGIESNILVLRLHHWEEVPETVRKIIDRIDARSRALGARIHDLLLLGALRSAEGRREPSGPVELRPLVDGVIEELSEKAKLRNIRMIPSIPELVIQSHGKRLEILLSNLLANAVSYSPEGKEVEVSAVEENGGVRIRVSDQGIGVQAEELPHIFDEYYRTPEATRFNKDSTGLGLAIVKQIAQNLGLKIVVSSEQGKGTTFDVVVPPERSVSHGSDQDQGPAGDPSDRGEPAVSDGFLGQGH